MLNDSKGKAYTDQALRKAVAASEARLMSRIRQLVEIETPSDVKQAVDRCVEAVVEMAASLGAQMRRHRQRGFGDVSSCGTGFPQKGRASARR